MRPLLFCPLEEELARRTRRLYEEVIARLQLEPAFWHGVYQPAKEGDLDAVVPLSRILKISAGRSTREAIESDGGHPDNFEGFANCRRSLFELAAYPDSAMETVRDAIIETGLNDDELWMLSSSILQSCDAGLSPEFRRFVGTGHGKLLLEPFHDASSLTLGQARLRRVLIKLGAISLNDLPQKERPKIPKALPSTIKELLSLARKLGMKGLKKRPKSHTNRLDKMELPAPLAELFEETIGTRELGIPEDEYGFKNLGGDLLDIIENHVQDLGVAKEDALFEMRDTSISLDPGKILPFANEISGDLFALTPELRSPDGQWLVVRCLHDEALTVELAALSLVEHLGRRVIEEWARREMAFDAVANLLKAPAVPGWLAK